MSNTKNILAFCIEACNAKRVRKLFVFIFIVFIYLSIYSLSSTDIFAAAACQPPGTDNTSGYCDNQTRPCCTPVGGTPYTCESTVVRGGSKTSCVPQTSSGGNQTCLGKDATGCTFGGGTASGTQCCSTDKATGKALTCDTNQNPAKCVISTAADCISTVGTACGAADTGQDRPCCQQTNGSGATLECLSNGQPSTSGNCGYQNISVTSANISPPPPPCANATPLPNGSPAHGGCASVDTAFGTWSTDPAGFVKSLFGILLSVSGGIAVLLIIFGGYKMVMSQGDPEKIQGAREQITSAIIGLLFLIFSLVILQVIGVDILHLPGFSGTNNTTNGSGSGGGTPTPNPALDATACKQVTTNPQCGLSGAGTGFFCGNEAGSTTSCQIFGNVGTLYKCDTNGNTVSFQRCPNQDCKTAIGAPNADYCGTGAILHYSCQKNGLCQQDPNGQYTTGNCNNACN